MVKYCPQSVIEHVIPLPLPSDIFAQDSHGQHRLGWKSLDENHVLILKKFETVIFVSYANFGPGILFPRNLRLEPNLFASPFGFIILLFGS